MTNTSSNCNPRIIIIGNRVLLLRDFIRVRPGYHPFGVTELLAKTLVLNKVTKIIRFSAIYTPPLIPWPSIQRQLKASPWTAVPVIDQGNDAATTTEQSELGPSRGISKQSIYYYYSHLPHHPTICSILRSIDFCHTKEPPEGDEEEMVCNFLSHHKHSPSHSLVILPGNLERNLVEAVGRIHWRPFEEPWRGQCQVGVVIVDAAKHFGPAPLSLSLDIALLLLVLLFAPQIVQSEEKHRHPASPHHGSSLVS